MLCGGFVCLFGFFNSFFFQNQHKAVNFFPSDNTEGLCYLFKCQLCWGEAEQGHKSSFVFSYTRCSLAFFELLQVSIKAVLETLQRGEKFCSEAVELRGRNPSSACS